MGRKKKGDKSTEMEYVGRSFIRSARFDLNPEKTDGDQEWKGGQKVHKERQSVVSQELKNCQCQKSG